MRRFTQKNCGVVWVALVDAINKNINAFGTNKVGCFNVIDVLRNPWGDTMPITKPKA